MSAFRVLVCGGRDYMKEWIVFGVLENLYLEHGERLVVIEGGARGADRAAAMWADTWAKCGHAVEHIQFKANWREHGKGAGPRRNAKMLAEGKPDLVVAFPGGAGTRNMIEQAKQAGVEVLTDV